MSANKVEIVVLSKSADGKQEVRWACPGCGKPITLTGDTDVIADMLGDGDNERETYTCMACDTEVN